MSLFSESALEKKLSELNNSAQSIQQLSLWVIHHRKHYQAVVRMWQVGITKVSQNRKLTYLYLANDVVQNSKKKYPEIAREFGTVMKRVMEHLAVLGLDEKTVKAIGRLLNIWRERNIFDPKIQGDLSRIWATKSLETVAAEAMPSIAPSPAKKSKDSPPKKKVKVAVTGAADSDDSSELLEEMLSPNVAQSPSATPDPPDPEELIKAMQALEHAASSDAVVREKIAKLPSSVSEVAQLASLKSPEDGRALMSKVEEATQLLNEYNERLQQELRDRKKVGNMITDFLAAQKDLEAQAEKRLEQYKDKLEKVNAVRNDLKSHIQSLPDLTKLPDVSTGGLAPLPSAGDLFTVK